PGGLGRKPLLEQRAVQAAEVRGRAQVAGRVEARARREAGELADQALPDVLADDERGSRRAMIGAGAVLRRAAPELAPQRDDDAIGDAAQLEVAPERADVRRRREEVVREA